ncbi:putative M protein [Aksy-Durug Melophagus sigmavirus]|uniref:putative M protein n=1 Tax=Aksy-Durug Melophagus sigmavirus TaxID=2909205 RepID=UPI002481A8A9|nr:putative M protein [Aksy-Durug Melophagus sigmavirus]UJG27961.1 putative M protein [Aksy-Durug Melophagus sigmavirus]UJG27976.1 putative M protein [Aksy-Durug Melophagus sigmavirus]UJG27981.1 putative M protein [Aksy-Durug Melophagus sigmavirus]
MKKTFKFPVGKKKSPLHLIPFNSSSSGSSTGTPETSVDSIFPLFESTKSYTPILKQTDSNVKITSCESRIQANLKLILSRIPKSWEEFERTVSDIIDYYDGCIYIKPFVHAIYWLLVQQLKRTQNDPIRVNMESSIDEFIQFHHDSALLTKIESQYNFSYTGKYLDLKYNLSFSIEFIPTIRRVTPFKEFLISVPVRFDNPPYYTLLSEAKINFTMHDENLIFHINY